MTFCFDVNFNRYTTYDKGFFWKNSIELGDRLLSFQNNGYINLGLKEVYLKYYQWKIINNKYKKLFENYLKKVNLYK